MLLALVPCAASAVDVAVFGAVIPPLGVNPSGWTAELVDLSTGNIVGQAVTDASGNFTFATATIGKQYVMSVSDPGNAYHADRVVTPTNGTNTVTFDFRPAISGRVTNAASGAGINGAVVSAWAFDPGVGAWTWVAAVDSLADGSYSMPKANLEDSISDYRIGFDALGYRTEYFNHKSTVASGDLVRFTGTAVAGINAALTRQPVNRIAGANRYSTSALIGAESVMGEWAGTVDVIIASGEDRAAADPLAAAGLSFAHYDCPILLVSSTSVSQEVKDIVKAMVSANPGTQIKIHVVGGRVSVPDARVNDIRNYVGVQNTAVERIDGANRYEVSRLIAEKVKAAWASDFGAPMPVPGVLIANGADPTKFFDALSMSAVSVSAGMPILLVQGDAVPAATSQALASMGVAASARYIAGGTRTVSEKVRAATGVPAANRLAGANRYSTARAIADAGLAKGWFESTYVGVAAKLPDALAGGAEVGSIAGPLLLTRPDVLSAETAGYISAHPTIGQVQVFGGDKSVSPAVVSQLAALVK
jgi:putative cell wall-binding protein